MRKKRNMPNTFVALLLSLFHLCTLIPGVSPIADESSSTTPPTLEPNIDSETESWFGQQRTTEAPRE